METYKIIILDNLGNEKNKNIKVNKKTTDKKIGRIVIDMINQFKKPSMS